MSDSLSKKTKLLAYLKENKIRKDWLAEEITNTTGCKITQVDLSHWLHGRREINNSFFKTTICKILEVSKDEIF